MNTKRIEITEGRDQGKVFQVEEMPVSRLEKWCARALLAMMGAELPSDVAQMAQLSSGVALVHAFKTGLRSLKWQDAEPLYDELLGYVYVLPDGAERGKIKLSQATLDAHIHDLKTVFKLRLAVLELSLGFSLGGGQ